jgi:hypothetical protein
METAGQLRARQLPIVEVMVLPPSTQYELLKSPYPFSFSPPVSSLKPATRLGPAAAAAVLPPPCFRRRAAATRIPPTAYQLLPPPCCCRWDSSEGRTRPTPPAVATPPCRPSCSHPTRACTGDSRSSKEANWFANYICYWYF